MLNRCLFGLYHKDAASKVLRKNLLLNPLIRRRRRWRTMSAKRRAMVRRTPVRTRDKFPMILIPLMVMFLLHKYLLPQFSPHSPTFMASLSIIKSLNTSFSIMVLSLFTLSFSCPLSPIIYAITPLELMVSIGIFSVLECQLIIKSSMTESVSSLSRAKPSMTLCLSTSKSSMTGTLMTGHKSFFHDGLRICARNVFCRTGLWVSAFLFSLLLLLLRARLG